MPDPSVSRLCDIRYLAAENTIYIDMAHFVPELALPVIEAICKTIAAADNPLGLFRHPMTGAETTLVFTHDAMLHQEAVALLVAEMFAACNNPAHICVETSATRPLTDELATQVKQHLNGYVADDRAKATWIWRCFEGEGAETDMLKAAGGDLQLVRP